MGDGQVFRLSGNTELGAISAEDSPDTSPDTSPLGAINLARARWDPLGLPGRPGTADLSGSVTLWQTDSELVLEAEIVDDIHVVQPYVNQMWMADSVQIAVSPDLPEHSASFAEFAIGQLTDGSAVVYGHVGTHAGTRDEASVQVTRDEPAKTTHYSARIPWTTLGFSARPETAFGLSFLVNENDTDAETGRDGFLEWGSGVGREPKDPAKFRTAILANVSDPGPGPETLRATASGRCLAGRIYLAVVATNLSDGPLAVDLTTLYGTKAFGPVGAGSSVSQSFVARQTFVPGGSVSVRGQGASGPAVIQSATYQPVVC
jgi:hypothetical protein